MKIANKQQGTAMGGNTDRPVTQEGRESYIDKAAVGWTAILQNDDEFVDAAADFDEARVEEIATGAHLQRPGNLTNHATGTVAERDEVETEEGAARNRSQPARNRVDQTTGEVDTIFGGGNGWGKDSALPLAPHMLGIHGGSGVSMIQQATTFPAEGHAPMSETEKNLHRSMMGGNPTLQNTGVGGNGMGGMTSPEAAPPAATEAGKQQFLVRGIIGWFAVTAAVRMFGLAATTKEFLTKQLK